MNNANNNNEKYNISVISSVEAEKLISEKLNTLINTIEKKDMKELATYIHPEKGVRFSTYGLVDKENDIVLSATKVSKIFKDAQIYNWGYYTNFEAEIKLTPKEYFLKYIYHSDFKKAEKVTFNEIIAPSGYMENQFLEYPEAIIVEFYFDYGDELDWKDIRFVFEKLENDWYLVGFINHEWTP